MRLLYFWLAGFVIVGVLIYLLNKQRGESSQKAISNSARTTISAFSLIIACIGTIINIVFWGFIWNSWANGDEGILSLAALIAAAVFGVPLLLITLFFWFTFFGVQIIPKLLKKK